MRRRRLSRAGADRGCRAGGHRENLTTGPVSIPPRMRVLATEPLVSSDRPSATPCWRAAMRSSGSPAIRSGRGRRESDGHLARPASDHRAGAGRRTGRSRRRGQPGRRGRSTSGSPTRPRSASARADRGHPQPARRRRGLPTEPSTSSSRQSAVGYYGDRGAEAPTRSHSRARASPPRSRSTGEAAGRPEDVFDRVVIFRTRLGARQGRRPPPSNSSSPSAGVGGPIAGGNQYMAGPDRGRGRPVPLGARRPPRLGVINATASNPVTNRELSRRSAVRCTGRPSCPSRSSRWPREEASSPIRRRRARVLPRRALESSVTSSGIRSSTRPCAAPCAERAQTVRGGPVRLAAEAAVPALRRGPLPGTDARARVPH